MRGLSIDFVAPAAAAVGGAGQPLTVGALTVDVVLETPTTLAGGGTQAVDTAVKNDFALVLTGSTTLNFTAFAAGRQGSIWVKQDGTGGRTITFTVAGAASGIGWNLVKETPDVLPQSAANSVTAYTYAMFTIGGTNYVHVSRSPLS